MGKSKADNFSELELINQIAGQQKGSVPDNLVLGIGDDCAVQRIADGRVSLLTTDTLVEGVHFDRRWHPGYLLGRKAVSVNVSDIAAMGGKPQFVLMSLGVSRQCEKKWFTAFLAGFKSVLEEYSLCLIGGDTVHSGERLMVSVTVVGEMAEADVRYRSAAKDGDLIWVSGHLGEAAGGLELCRKNIADKKIYQPLVKAHLDPEPKVTLGMEMAESGLVNAMMDISDGLATDLAHICSASEVGAEIDGSAVPLSSALLDAAQVLNCSPFDLALKGGEDYQLVFTSPAENRQKVISLASDLGQRLYCVGRIVEGTGVLLCQDDKRVDISYRGYEHTF